jgi:hypothetical protein
MLLKEIFSDEKALKDKKRFHTIMLKLLYLGTCGRAEIVLAVLLLYTRVRSLTKPDQQKLERVLGYLKSWL